MKKNILITGASSGLGAGMAREFAKRGDNLALCARRLERLQQLRDELATAYPHIKIALRTLDVTDHAQVFDVFRAFREEMGSLDRVIVNAGIGQGVPIGKGDFARNKAIVETNFIAALAQCEAAMEIFRAQKFGLARRRRLPGRPQARDQGQHAVSRLYSHRDERACRPEAHAVHDRRCARCTPARCGDRARTGEGLRAVVAVGAARLPDEKHAAILGCEAYLSNAARTWI